MNVPSPCVWKITIHDRSSWPISRKRKSASFFHEGLLHLDLRVPEEIVSRLVRYCVELQKWNKKVNLVAKNTSLRDLVEKHFIDSLLLLPQLRKHTLTGKALLDVGSGAGFPGLVVHIANPLLHTILLEPRQRRVSFLNHIIRSLSIENIRVVMERIETGNLLAKENFSVITGRAVADIPTFLDMVSPRTGKDTLVVCMQGEKGKKQWQVKNQDSGFEWVDTKEYTLPFSGDKRYLLLYRKGGYRGQ